MAAARREKGTGSYGLRPRPDGRWQGHVTLPDGTRKTVLRRTDADMRAGVDALLAQLDTGRPEAPSDPTLAEYLVAWIAGRRDGEIGRTPLAPSTVLLYEQRVRLQIIPSIGGIRLSRLRWQDVERLLSDLRRRKCSNTVRLQAYRLLSVALKLAERRGQVARNPCALVDAPPPAERTARDLDTEDVVAVLRAAAGHPHEALLWVAVCTGARQGELFALRWQDIDLDAGRVQIREKVQWLSGLGSQRSAPKTQAGARAMSLPSLAVAALRAHKAAQDAAGHPNPLGLAFPTRTGAHLQASNWNRQVWRAWLRAAGVDETVQFRILTRKAHHSLLVVLGVDAETLRHRAGHTRASTTMDHYVMSVRGADEAAARKLDGALRDLLSAKPPRKQSDKQSMTSGFPGAGTDDSKGKPSRRSG